MFNFSIILLAAQINRKIESYTSGYILHGRMPWMHHNTKLCTVYKPHLLVSTFFRLLNVLDLLEPTRGSWPA